MLKAIELENFKAFGQRTRIELAPITLIVGQNSSGKSSILQSLSLLKQTRESRESGVPLLPRAEQGLVDLGSFQELLFDHDLSRQLFIRVDVALNTARAAAPLRRLGSGSHSPKTLGLQLRFCRPSAADEVQLRELQTMWDKLDEPFASFEPRPLTVYEHQAALRYSWAPLRGRRSVKRSRLRGAACTAVSSNRLLWEPCFRAWHARREDIVTRLRRHGSEIVYRPRTLFEADEVVEDARGSGRQEFLREVEAAASFYASDFTLEQFTSRMINAARELVVSLDGFLPTALRPIRPWRAPELELLGERGRGNEQDLPIVDISFITFAASRAVEEALDSLFPMGPYRRPPERWYIFTGTSPDDVGYRGDLLPDLLFRRSELVDAANKWLDRLDIGYALRVRPIGEGIGGRASDLFEVRLIDKTRAKPVDVALSDVGFGISQILPFVVQCLASERQIISIEQPEVHIHPKLQADLGELIAAGVSEPYGHQFLIETHSEHLILRLQKLVRERRLKPADISVIFVSRGAEGSRARRLRLDESGRFIDEWPGGFFAERLRELR